MLIVLSILLNKVPCLLAESVLKGESRIIDKESCKSPMFAGGLKILVILKLDNLFIYNC